MKSILFFPPLFAALVVPAAPARAQGTPETPVIAVVKVPKPWYAPRALVVSKMRETVPEYEKLPGLSFKMFSLAQSDGQFGGIYFWRNQASAAAWFDAAWFARVKKERGHEAELRYFEALLSLDNSPSAGSADDGRSVATLVLLPAPAGMTRQRLLDEFRAAVPGYQKIPGLMRKHFVATDIGQPGARFGGLYLWRDQASADQWFNAPWRERVRSAYGLDANLEWFDTPILAPSKLAENQLDMIRP